MLSAQILPSIISKEEKYDGDEERNGEGRDEQRGIVSADQGFSREVKTQIEVFPLSLSASVVLPQIEGKNLIIELLKISLLAEAHLHV